MTRKSNRNFLSCGQESSKDFQCCIAVLSRGPFLNTLRIPPLTPGWSATRKLRDCWRKIAFTLIDRVVSQRLRSTVTSHTFRKQTRLGNR